MTLNPQALDAAAQELVRAAGRPELLLSSLSPVELAGWRLVAERTVRVYLAAAEKAAA